MKIKLCVLGTLLLCFNLSFSQVGIGTTTPDASSALDITSTDKGLLIPRVNISDLNNSAPINNPTESLLVYSADDNNRGFYFWKDNKWNALTGSEGSPRWSINGNNASSSDFFGTTNYNPIRIKVDGSDFGQFHPNGGISLGLGAIANNNHSIAIGTSANTSSVVDATAVGNSSSATSYRSSAFGFSSQAIGNEATAIGMSATASGFQSIALGHSSNASNNEATAIGKNSTASAHQSTAIGYNSSTSGGNNSLAVGHSANATGQNSTALGYNASTSQNNAIVIGDSNSNIGIATSTPDTNTKLDVAGQYKLGSRGTVQKNQLSFSVGENLGNITEHGSNIITITIPHGARPSTINASIVVTPENSMSDDLYIAWAKLDGTNKLRLKLTNTSSNNFYNPYTKFYITINEF